MAISMDSALFSQMATNNTNKNKASEVTDKLNNLNSKTDDKELMEACETFEQYLIEQVIKNTRSAMLTDEDSNGDYMKIFGDTMNQEYAKILSQNGNLGIAKMMFDSIKSNNQDK